MKHLISNEGHDESEVWCGKDFYYRDEGAEREPMKADCVACLRAASEYGHRVTKRLADIAFVAMHGLTIAEIDAEREAAKRPALTEVIATYTKYCMPLCSSDLHTPRDGDAKPIANASAAPTPGGSTREG